MATHAAVSIIEGAGPLQSVASMSGPGHTLVAASGASTVEALNSTLTSLPPPPW
ncbi:hypothetical protein POX_a01364 [Penicillium oxalicum]|uniref:hypothetical protein n=1 Tax=Penicillium oxalicum TaxID=69781 RepID=UPI0020B8F19E|nr:hypothetical protein POX_a01364 [Penicillium oxalicum]KAI2794763.1 hypothetical protein POX_a01364 [Penicillium oxalicum]